MLFVYLLLTYATLGVPVVIYLYTLDEGWDCTGVEAFAGGLVWPYIFYLLWQRGGRPWHIFQRLCKKLHK